MDISPIQKTIEKKYPGKFIVFEGIDGSGKATQTKLLIKKLKRLGCSPETIDFPQYGKKSAGLIEEYLNGKYGQADKVGPWRASIFYACDRYDGSFPLKEWLEKGKIVVADRYIGSNIGHQGGKIKDKEERIEYIKWLYSLEYGLFGIPKPDLTFVLKTLPHLSSKLAGIIVDREKKEKKSLFLGKKLRDIHERDVSHLENTLRAYLETAEIFPEEFIVTECMDGDKMRSPGEIHNMVWEKIKEIL